MDDVRLDLPAYERAMGEFVFSVLWGFARLDDLIGQIADRPSIHTGPSRNVHGPNPLDQPMSTVGQEILVHLDVIREGRVEDFIELLCKAADQYVAQLQKFFIVNINEVIEAGGKVIDAKGEVLTFDHFIELLDGLEIRSNEDGTLVLPQMIMNPKTLEMLQQLEVTDEQKQRFNDILRRKANENMARKRVRRLSTKDASNA